MTGDSNGDGGSAAAGDSGSTPGRAHNAMARPFVLKPANITADEARALIDGVIRGYGLDPAQCLVDNDWRQLGLSGATVRAGVIDWRGGSEQHFVVFSRVLDLPVGEVPSAFLRTLLELSHDRTLAARFTIRDNAVFVSATRPIGGLDEEEVDYAIRSVLSVAGGTAPSLGDTLRQMARDVPLPFAELPQVKATPKEMQGFAEFLGRCQPHARAVYRSVIERWHGAGFATKVGAGSVHLLIPVGKRPHSLASLGPVLADGRQMIVLPWERLHHNEAFGPGAGGRFQTAIRRIVAVEATESTAHLDVTPDFTEEKATALVRALVALASAFVPEHAALAGLVTPGNTEKTLEACPEHVAAIYRLLVDGWARAGGTVQCMRPGRIYLKLQTSPHAGGGASAITHKFNLAVLAAPRGKQPPAIDVAWGMAGNAPYAYLDAIPGEVARFEAVVAGLPGFRQKGTVTQLVMAPEFTTTCATALLEAMVRVKDAEAAAP